MMKRNMQKILALSLGAALSAGLLSGCGSGQSSASDESGASASESSVTQSSSSASESSTASATETRVVTDMSGTEVEIPAEVDTYVESWYAHNAFDIMFDEAEGMLMTCCDPDSYQWMYKVCSNMNDAAYAKFSTDMNVEEILALHPDVVFGSNEDYREMFETVGIPYINCMFTTYETMLQSAQLTAEVLGTDAEEIYAQYETYFNDRVDFVEERVADLEDSEKVTVLHGSSVHDLDVDGSNTIIDQWITAAGGLNAAGTEIEGNMQTATLEQIIDWNPDIIITGDSQVGVDVILNDSAWSSIKAVQDGNVFVNPKGVFLWDRYGVEGGLQILWAAKTFYPDLFEDVDMVSEVQTFYHDFLHYDLTEEDVNLILAHEDPAD